MNNPRINNKERGLIKGAIRRVFSRSDLRKAALDAASIDHSDPTRPRVQKWCKCAKCGQVVPKYTCDVDHIDPVVPIHVPLEAMDWDDLVNRVWCEAKNLQVMCDPCHREKTKKELKLRNAARKVRKQALKDKK